jgi:hypothetical protein
MSEKKEKIFSVVEYLHSNDNYSLWVTDDRIKFDDMSGGIPLDQIDDLINALVAVKSLEF